MSTPVTPQDGRANTAHWSARDERGSSWAMQLMIRLSLLLGRRLTRPVLWFIAAYFVIAAREARHASRDYLKRVLGGRVTPWHVFRHFLCFAVTIHDRIFLLNDQADLLNITMIGEEAMHAVNDEQGGLLLFGAHMGSFGALRATAGTLSNRSIAMAMYEENALKISRMLARINPTTAHEIVPLGHLDSMLQVQDRLARGQMVGILADRTFGKNDVRFIPVLESPAPLPVGAFRMAAILRVPVFFMVSLYRGGNRYEVHFEPLVNFNDYAPEEKEAAMAEALQNYANMLTRYCREAPYNWFNFFEFWNVRTADAVNTRMKPKQTHGTTP